MKLKDLIAYLKDADDLAFGDVEVAMQDIYNQLHHFSKERMSLQPTKEGVGLLLVISTQVELDFEPEKTSTSCGNHQQGVGCSWRPIDLWRYGHEKEQRRWECSGCGRSEWRMVNKTHPGLEPHIKTTSEQITQ